MSINPLSLTFVDLDAQALIDAARSHAASRMPGFVWREGTPEETMLQAFALIAEETVLSLNRLPETLLRAWLRLQGLYPSPGVQPVATATITINSTTGLTIPAGARLRLLTSNVVPVEMVFTTDSPLVFVAGVTTGTVGITANDFTSIGNSTPVATRLAVLDSVAYIDSAVLATAVSGGVNPETDAAWVIRTSNRLSRLVDSLQLLQHFEAYALEQVEVTRAHAFGNWDSASGNPVGGDEGHITIVACGPSGAPLNTTFAANLLVDMTAKAVVSLVVHLINFTLTTINVTATVTKTAGYTNAAVLANVTTALADYLNPDTWAFSTTVQPNELLVVIDAASGVDLVVAVTLPAAPVTIGDTGLPVLGTVTLTYV